MAGNKAPEIAKDHGLAPVQMMASERVRRVIAEMQALDYMLDGRQHLGGTTRGLARKIAIERHRNAQAVARMQVLRNQLVQMGQ